jgi:TolA-binding protein
MIPSPARLALLLLVSPLQPGLAQEAETPPGEEASDAPRGSIVEDRAARKLLDAGDTRLAADETDKALEIWRSVIERYPRSRIRFDAHLRLGSHLLEKQRAFDEARQHFLAASKEENPDADQRAAATLKTGVCFFEAREFGKCFEIMRGVIDNFPSSDHVNQAYYYIGLGHFKLGHYSRAIEALEKVGTALSSDDVRVEKAEAGQRLHIRVDDRDLAVLQPGQSITVTATTRSGDSESVECLPVGRNVRVVLGSIPTTLGSPIKDNGILEIRGGDILDVTYTDSYTEDLSPDAKRLREVRVVGTARVGILDGSYQENIEGVVLGKTASLQVADADFDTSDNADSLQATATILRRKSQDELDDELAARVARGEAPDPAATSEGETPADPTPDIDPYKPVDSLRVTLTESAPHSGIFRATVPLEATDATRSDDQAMQSLPGDLLRLTYLDENHIAPESREVTAEATTLVGNLGDVRVTRSEISDEELRIKTLLRTAGALTRVGGHYQEFGLQEKAQLKYGEALDVCETIAEDAQKVGGPLLEETYVQLWRIYFAMDNLGLAEAMSQRLQREFPESTFIDEATLQQARIAQKRNELGRAINLFENVVRLEKSLLRGEAQFGIAECYEALALAAPPEQAEPHFERAFTEYQKVYEQFPDSGRVGEAVAKMANFFYQKQDYARAIDVFESVLTEHPDASFLDVILFNYGRCLYRLDRKTEASRQFDQLITDFPESTLAPEAKRIAEALAKS